MDVGEGEDVTNWEITIDICVCVYIQNCSVTKSCPTFWDPTGRSSPGFPFLHRLPEFSQMLKYVCVLCIYS